jgi:hypothetical protein
VTATAAAHHGHDRAFDEQLASSHRRLGRNGSSRPRGHDPSVSTVSELFV